MPELPEVEITRRGIEPHLVGQVIRAVVLRHRGLRYPFPAALAERLTGRAVTAVMRRAKYLLLYIGDQVLLIHLGMSGCLRMVSCELPPAKHDHFDLVLDKEVLRLRDPRRFGAVLLLTLPVEDCALLQGLGLEPLSGEFSAEALHSMSRNRNTPVKQFIMDGKRIVGVGNIYASESLFRAGIHPMTKAGSMSKRQCAALVEAIKSTLLDALAAGGSSLKDFVHSDGSSGYFQQQYAVYGRGGEACHTCGSLVKRCVLGQRATFFCPVCQKKTKSS